MKLDHLHVEITESGEGRPSKGKESSPGYTIMVLGTLPDSPVRAKGLLDHSFQQRKTDMGLIRHSPPAKEIRSEIGE